MVSTLRREGIGMKKYSRVMLVSLLALVMACSFALFGCSNNTNNDSNADDNATPTQEQVELQIFAANSLTKALAEVQDLYVADHDWVSFADTQFEASGTLVESLTAGSSADILITASKGTMDSAEEGQLVDPTTRFDMFTNDLVIVAKEGSGLSDVTLQDIAEGKYTVAVGDDAVPAGNYAAQALSTVGAYEDPSGETGKNATGKEGAYVGINPALESSVGNVCKKAEAGEVDLAIVYSSDVYRFGGVEIVGVIADDTHKSIIYPAAITADTKVADEADAFLQWAITDSSALRVWQKWGFELAA